MNEYNFVPPYVKLFNHFLFIAKKYLKSTYTLFSSSINEIGGNILMWVAISYVEFEWASGWMV